MGAGLLRQAVFVAEGLYMLSVCFSHRSGAYCFPINIPHQASLSDGPPSPNIKLY